MTPVDKFEEEKPKDESKSFHRDQFCAPCGAVQPILAERYHGLETNVWVEFCSLAKKYNAISLGQGFINYAPPDFYLRALREVTEDQNACLHQYTRPFGHPRLVTAVARIYSKAFDRTIDPMNEILITVGAFEALFACILGMLDPNDECIIIEPFFDCYEPMVRLTGATPIFVPLRPVGDKYHTSNWKLDLVEFYAAFTPKTKILLFCTPNNPLGKVYSKTELEFIAQKCIEFNVICIADEVYQHIVYPGSVHTSIATLPGMWDRTITIGSAGKTFSITGIRIGWAVAPNSLLIPLQCVHQHSINMCSTINQEVVARCFEHELALTNTEESYFVQMGKELKPKRDLIIKMMQGIGMQPIEPEGAYFLMADFSTLKLSMIFESEEFRQDPWNDVKLVKYLMKYLKVAAIPVTAFYTQSHKHFVENYIRLCYAKDFETLLQAKLQFHTWLSSVKDNISNLYIPIELVPLKQFANNEEDRRKVFTRAELALLGVHVPSDTQVKEVKINESQLRIMNQRKIIVSIRPGPSTYIAERSFPTNNSNNKHLSAESILSTINEAGIKMSEDEELVESSNYEYNANFSHNDSTFFIERKNVTNRSKNQYVRMNDEQNIFENIFFNSQNQPFTNRNSLYDCTNKMKYETFDRANLPVKSYLHKHQTNTHDDDDGEEEEDYNQQLHDDVLFPISDEDNQRNSSFDVLQRARLLSRRVSQSVVQTIKQFTRNSVNQGYSNI
ncbi:hypothetical protein SNEBB_002795 [Seison nebaliae]|nr:hypothetical protein SNEBB_002795 [Seison nebaliae]